MDRTHRLKEEYESLRVDLLAEINTVDDRMIKPAMEAKDYLQPMKKVIKKRDDKKVENPYLVFLMDELRWLANTASAQLDYERYLGRVDTAMKKSKRSDRENAALAKAEVDLAKAKEVRSSSAFSGRMLTGM